MKKSEIFDILVNKVCDVCEVRMDTLIHGSKLQSELALFRAVAEYGLDQVVPDFSGIPQQPFVEAIFAGIRPQLDANHKRFLNGCKGGAPVGNRNNPNGRKGGTNQEPTRNQPGTNRKTT